MHYPIHKACFIAAAVFLTAACKVAHLPTKAEYSAYRITAERQRDSALLVLTQPYCDSVTNSMSEVVAIAEQTLEKTQPEGTLGNFMADAMLYGARKQFNTAVDAAFVNYGGIRLTQLAKGEVTRGKIFELMPFDNLIVLLRVKGDVLQQFLDFTAERGGWPAAGINMQIQNKKAVGVHVNGQPLDKAKVYVVATSDYVANGGDNAVMLKGVAQENRGYLFRDALFDYIKWHKEERKSIGAKNEKRVIYAQ